MPTPSFTSEVYIAFQLQLTSTGNLNEGWASSNCDYLEKHIQKQTETKNDGSIVTIAENKFACLPHKGMANPGKFPDAPATLNSWGKLLNCTMEVSREYAGINSSGGPQVAGRADHSDVVIERYCDGISPYLFQYCAAAWQIKKVYIIRYIGSDKLFFNFCHEWVLEGVQVTDYRFTHDRYFNSPLGITYLSSIETFSLLYTSAKYRCSKFEGSDLNKELTEFRGWDTGKNKGINMPS